MSPASGDKLNTNLGLDWLIVAVSIQLMSPASGDLPKLNMVRKLIRLCFHSINVPSEWGQHIIITNLFSYSNVSIQLMSPASGDNKIVKSLKERGFTGFHSINVPSEWGR